MQKHFSPCPDSPPIIDNCAPEPPVVTATCNPTGNSTISITRSFGPAGEFGHPALGSGRFSETITATIGPQNGPVVPEFQPIESSGFRTSSRGFRTGKLLSLTSTFQIQLLDANGDIYRIYNGQKTLVDHIANTGVCREFDDEPVGEHATFPPGLVLDGYYYIVNAQVLGYEGVAQDYFDGAFIGENPLVPGVAHMYLNNSYASSGEPAAVNNADGILLTAFGDTRGEVTPFEPVPLAESATSVEVVPAPGVTLTFPNVTSEGEASVTAILDIADVPPPPANIQVGEPPMLYDISTTASFTGEVLVCVPYGPLPEGMQPTLWHFDDDLGTWVDVTESFDPETKTVCGLVSSFSPFLVGYVPAGPTYELTGPFQPVDAQPAENVLQAGQTVPVRFSLGGEHGLDVFADDSPSSTGAPCSGGTPDTIEATSNGAGLTYDAATGVYTYHWKTVKGWKGQCRTLTLEFLDGSELAADFRFK